MNLNKSDAQLVTEARAEILALRRANEILSAKVEVMELFACVLHTKPAERCVPCAPDVAYQLHERLATL